MTAEVAPEVLTYRMTLVGDVVLAAGVECRVKEKLHGQRRLCLVPTDRTLPAYDRRFRYVTEAEYDAAGVVLVRGKGRV